MEGLSASIVYDPHLVQDAPSYVIHQGGSEVSSISFTAQSVSASSLQFTGYMPNTTSFLDRDIQLSAGINLVVIATKTVGALQILSPGGNVASCGNPFNTLCTQVAASINNESYTINSQNVFAQYVRLLDSKRNNVYRTSPAAIPRYGCVDDGLSTTGSWLAGYDTGRWAEDSSPGAYSVVFTDPTGNALLPNQTPAFVGAGYNTDADGIPVNAAAGTYTLYVRLNTTEPVFVSPFIFSPADGESTGLSGINQFQLTFTLGSAAKLLSWSYNNSLTISSISLNASIPFTQPVLNCIYRSPNIKQPLPPRSVIPYTDVQQLGGQNAQIVPGRSVVSMQSGTFSLPGVPELLVIYCPCTSGVDSNGISILSGNYPSPFLVPDTGIASNSAGSTRPLSLTFDSANGLCSGYTAETLFRMSVDNGLNVDWPTWRGVANQLTKKNLPTSGSFIVLRPGKDFKLSAGVAPGVAGQYQLQISLSVYNQFSFPVQTSLSILAVNSGFSLNENGASTKTAYPITPAMVMSSQVQEMPSQMRKMTMLGGSVLSKLSSFVSKAADVYKQVKPVLSVVKQHLKDDGTQGAIKGVLDFTGHGTGAGTGAGKKKGGMRRRRLPPPVMYD